MRGDYPFIGIAPVRIYKNTPPHVLEAAQEHHLLVTMCDFRKSHAEAASFSDLGLAMMQGNCIGETVVGVGPSVRQARFFDHNLVPNSNSDDIVHHVDDCVRSCGCTFGKPCKHCPAPTSSGVKFIANHSGYYISPVDQVRQHVTYARQFDCPLSKQETIYHLNQYSSRHGSCGESSFSITGDHVYQNAGGDFDGYDHPLDNLQQHLTPRTVVRQTNLSWRNLIPALLLPRRTRKVGASLMFLCGLSMLGKIYLNRLPPKYKTGKTYKALHSICGFFTSLRYFCVVRKVTKVHAKSNSVLVSSRVVRGIHEKFTVPVPAAPVGDVVPVSYRFAGLDQYVNVPLREFLTLKAIGCQVAKADDMERRIIQHWNKNKLDPIPEEAMRSLALSLYKQGYRDSTDAVECLASPPEHLKSFDFMWDSFKTRIPSLLWWGPGTRPGLVPSVFRDNQESELSGLLGRVLKRPPPVDEGVWAKAGRHFAESVDFDDEEPLQLMDKEDYYDCLPSKRRADAVATFERMDLEGREVDDIMPRYNGFVKIEKGGDRIESQWKDPRIIQGPDPETKHVLSLWCRPFSKWLNSVCNGSPDSARSAVNNALYASGLTPLEMGAWKQECVDAGFNAFVLEVDFSRWDSTISLQALAEEYKVFKALHCPSEIIRLFLRTNKGRGSTQNGIRYTVVGGRHSGDADTSCGNSLLNIMIHIYALDLICGQGNYRLAVLGDDMVCFFNAEGAARFNRVKYVEIMHQAGLVPEIREDATVETASFCSQYFYACHNDKTNEDTFCLGSKPGRGIFRFGWTDNSIPPTVEQQRGECLSKFPGCSVVPGLSVVVARTLQTIGDGAIEYPRWVAFLQDNLNVPSPATQVAYLHPTADTDLMLRQIYGLGFQELQAYYVDEGHDEFVRFCMLKE